MKVIVISVGGSLIVPNKVDYKFLLKLKRSIKKISRKYKVVICTGGGSVARDYIQALKKFKLSELKQDLVGIEATRFNAKLVSIILNANKVIPSNIEELIKLIKRHNIIVCGGFKPGQTSDGTTAAIAAKLNAQFLVNITNVKGLFDKDPKKFKDAKFIPRIKHSEFEKILAKVKQKPGQHFVLDSYAAKLAKKFKINVLITNDLKELENYLQNKKFNGTIIY